jgi:heme-degrading monooxygenase HmoA
MYATVRTYSGAPGLADALVEREDDVRRLIGDIDGFRAYYLLRTADGVVSVSVFDTEAGTDESIKAAAGFVGENMPELAVTPTVSSGEVIVSF